MWRSPALTCEIYAPGPGMGFATAEHAPAGWLFTRGGRHLLGGLRLGHEFPSAAFLLARRGGELVEVGLPAHRLSRAEASVGEIAFDLALDDPIEALDLGGGQRRLGVLGAAGALLLAFAARLVVAAEGVPVLAGRLVAEQGYQFFLALQALRTITPGQPRPTEEAAAG